MGNVSWRSPSSDLKNNFLKSWKDEYYHFSVQQNCFRAPHTQATQALGTYLLRYIQTSAPDRFMLASETWKSERKCVKYHWFWIFVPRKWQWVPERQWVAPQCPPRPEKSREYRLHPVAALVASYIGLMELKTPNSWWNRPGPDLIADLVGSIKIIPIILGPGNAIETSHVPKYNRGTQFCPIVPKNRRI